MNEFYKTVTEECVPVELGGKLPLTIEQMTSKVLKYFKSRVWRSIVLKSIESGFIWLVMEIVQRMHRNRI